YVSGVAAAPDGVYVAGTPYGSLEGASAGGSDAFVRKYDPDGFVLWTDQFGSAGSDAAQGVAVGSDGVYVAGSLRGALEGTSSAGNFDAFVRKYDPDGNALWTRRFGTPDEDVARGVAAAADGVYVAGSTYGSLRGATSAGSFDAFVRKY